MAHSDRPERRIHLRGHALARAPLRVHWAPYIWLVYLPGVFVAPILDRAGVRVWMSTVGAVLLFVPLHLYAYALRGLRSVYWVIALIALLGALLTPLNPTASLFMVYAGALAGMIRPPRHALYALVLLLAIIAVEALLIGTKPAVWAGEIFFTALVGAVNGLFTTVQSVEGELRRAREEIAHLAVLRERERIARDLHDVLGHTLSLITLKSALAERLVAQLSASAEQELRGIGEIARGALDEVRSAVAGYRESSLNREFAAARVMLDAAGVLISVDGRCAALDPHEDAMLALVVREAVTNVARHANASRCAIRLFERDRNRELEVADDGRGSTINAAPGGGIEGMRARVESLGGRLFAGPNGSDRGWVLRAVLPPAGHVVTPRLTLAEIERRAVATQQSA